MHTTPLTWAWASGAEVQLSGFTKPLLTVNFTSEFLTVQDEKCTRIKLSTLEQEEIKFTHALEEVLLLTTDPLQAAFLASQISLVLQEFFSAVKLLLPTNNPGWQDPFFLIPHLLPQPKKEFNALMEYFQEQLWLI